MTQELAAFVGIDWADEKHAACLIPAAGGIAQQTEIEQTPEAITAWAADLRVRFDGRPIGVCLEQSRGALVYALMQYDFLVLYPINPKQLAAYREALYPSGAKNDPNDAELVARFLRDHSDKLRARHPDDEATRALRLFTEQRRKWVEDRVALTNELRQRLKESYPLALELSGDNLASESFLALLEKFPSQRELQRSSPKQLQEWLPRRRRVADDPPTAELLRQRIAAIRKVPLITTDRPVLEHSRLAISHLVLLLKAINHSISECEQKISEQFAKHPDAELFASFPGAGPALAPRLASAYGSDRDKLQDARDMQQLSGIAPVMRTSGKSKIVLMRWACPKFLRQTFHEHARCSTSKSRWARAYVVMRTQRGDSYQQILRGLAFKWQRIIFRCWKTNQPYDEERYIRRLHATGSELVKFISENPPKNA